MKNLPINGFHGIKRNSSIYRTLMDKLSDSLCDDKNDDSYKDEVIRYAINETEGHCIYCGKKLYILKNNEYKFNEKATLDHLIPVSDWGLFAKGNIALACCDCNSKRGNMSPEDYFMILHQKNIPTLYDTLEEFNAHLSDFSKPYRDKFPQIFTMGKYFMNKGQHSEKISLKVSYNIDNVEHEISFPEFDPSIDKSSNNILNATNKPLSNNANELPTSSEKIFLNKVVSHLIKMSGIQNPQKKQSFNRAAVRTLLTMNKMGFKNKNSIKNMEKSGILGLQRVLFKQNDISLSRTKLVLSYIGIAFDNPNFETQEGLMPFVIENMGSKYLFDGD